MAATVTRTRISLGNYAAVILKVTGDASDAYFATGLSNVLFAKVSSQTDDDGNAGQLYPNYSDAGSAAAAGTVFLENTPGSSEIVYIFAIGNP